MQEGSLRCDANVNLHIHQENGETIPTPIVEIKNLNSFRSVEKAAEYEFARQVALLEKGETIVQETRGWDEATAKTVSQRSKEDAQDYRYMPDADIPPVVLSEKEIEEIQKTVPMLPPQYRQAWSELSLDSSVINSLLSDQSKAKLLYEVQQVAGNGAATRVAHWFSSTVAESDEDPLTTEAVLVRTEDLIELASMTDAQEISSTSAKDIFVELMNGRQSPRAIAETKNLLQVSDEGIVANIVDEVLADPASQKAIADIKAGNDKAIGFLVGQIMKKSQGKANPAMAQKLIREKL